MSGSRSGWVAALAILGLGLAVLGVGLVAGSRPGAMAWAEAAAQQVPGRTDGAGALVSTTVLSDSEVVICVVDTVRQHLVVYVADAKKSRLRLLASRDIAADALLTDWNNDPPLPKDVRARVEKWAETSKPEPGAAPEKK